MAYRYSIRLGTRTYSVYTNLVGAYTCSEVFSASVHASVFFTYCAVCCEFATHSCPSHVYFLKYTWLCKLAECSTYLHCGNLWMFNFQIPNLQKVVCAKFWRHKMVRERWQRFSGFAQAKMSWTVVNNTVVGEKTPKTITVGKFSLHKHRPHATEPSTVKESRTAAHSPFE